MWAIQDEGTQQHALAFFDRKYPPGSPVGQYVRRRTFRDRGPITLVRELGNYTLVQGMLQSVSARAQAVYQRVEAEEGRDAARQKAEVYVRWWFMLPELEQRIQASQASQVQNEVPAG